MGRAKAWTTTVIISVGSTKTRTTPLRRINIAFAGAIFGHDNRRHSTAVVHRAPERCARLIGRIKQHADKFVTQLRRFYDAQRSRGEPWVHSRSGEVPKLAVYRGLALYMDPFRKGCGLRGFTWRPFFLSRSPRRNRAQSNCQNSKHES
jgi:hypothetical protein